MRRFLGGMIAAALLASAGLAQAAAPVAGSVPVAVTMKITEARQRDPTAFASVERIRSEYAGRSMDNRAVVAASRKLRALGASALWPMLGVLAEAAPEGDPSALRFRIAVLDAVAKLKSPEAAPVFSAILGGPERDPRVAVAAARGLGMLCRDEDVTTLRGFAAGGARQLAAIEGLGSCRRGESGAALRGLIEARPDALVAGTAARALGRWGSSWAWQAMGAAASEASVAERDAAVRSLVSAWSSYRGDARLEIERALLMLDRPGTPAVIGELGAGEALQQRWDRAHKR